MTPTGPDAPEPSPPASAAARSAAAGASPPSGERRLAADRRTVDRRTKQLPVANDRRSGLDRRADAEVGSDDDLLEFLRAIHDFKERTGKAFPAWSDVLRIVRELGYEKRT